MERAKVHRKLITDKQRTFKALRQARWRRNGPLGPARKAELIRLQIENDRLLRAQELLRQKYFAVPPAIASSSSDTDETDPNEQEKVESAQFDTHESSGNETTKSQVATVNISVIQNMMRIEFANINRRLSDMEVKVDKLAYRCDRIPAMSNDLTAFRREVAELRLATDNIAAAASRREMERAGSDCSTASEMQPNGDQWPVLPISSDGDWDLATALVISEEAMPQSKRPFINYLARRIVSHARNAKAPIKAAIRCIIDDEWASRRMSMLGWRIVNGCKEYGFKSFSDLRPLIITTLKEMLALNVSRNAVYEALSEELRYWKRKHGTQRQVHCGEHDMPYDVTSDIELESTATPATTSTTQWRDSDLSSCASECTDVEPDSD